MSDEVFKRTIADCIKCKIHTLIFAGPWGEPTLHPDWEKHIRQSVERGFTTILSTNASRLNTKAVKYLATSGIETLQVSFSGFDKKSYESIYVNGKFQVIRKVLRNLKKYFIRYGGNTYTGNNNKSLLCYRSI